MSTCPQPSHFSHASAGISNRSRCDVRGLRSFLNHAIKAIGGGLETPQSHVTAPEAPDPSHKLLSDFMIARLPRIPGDPGGEAQTNHTDHKKGAAIGEERQRDAGNGHEVDRHADVLEDVREEEAGNPEHDEAAECI